MAQKRNYGTGSLIEDHPRDWYGRWRPEGARNPIKRKIGPKKSKDCPDGLTRTQAERKLQRMVAGEDGDDIPRESGRTVEFVGQQTLLALEAKERKTSHRTNFESHLRNHIAPYFKGRNIVSIDESEIERFMAHLNRKKSATGKPLAPKTKKNILITLGTVMEHALRKKWIKSNPVRMVEKPQVADSDADIRFLRMDELEAVLRQLPVFYSKRRQLTWEQIQAVRESSAPSSQLASEYGVSDALLGRIRKHQIYTEDDHTLDLCQLMDRGMILMAAMTGMRRGELLALRWRDVDWVAQKARVRRSYVNGEWTTPKSKRSVRGVPLVMVVAAVLDELHQATAFKEDDDLVFAHPMTGNPISGDAVRTRFQKMCAMAGVRVVRFHDLRHTFGTTMAAAGVPMRTLQEWLGHRDSKTTEIYADYSPSEHEVQMAEDAFAQAGAIAGETRTSDRRTHSGHKFAKTQGD